MKTIASAAATTNHVRVVTRVATTLETEVEWRRDERLKTIERRHPTLLPI
jgi:hypothetical protein